jgi:hypothetical protein
MGSVLWRDTASVTPRTNTCSSGGTAVADDMESSSAEGAAGQLLQKRKENEGGKVAVKLW